MTQRRLWMLTALFVAGVPVVASAQFTPTPTDLKLINGAAPTVAICGDEKKRVQIPIDATASTTTIEVVPLSGTTVIYVCDVKFFAGGAAKIQFVSGHGTLCATALTVIDPNQPAAAGDGWVENGGGFFLFKTIAGDALCFTRDASVTAVGRLTIVQQESPP